MCWIHWSITSSCELVSKDKTALGHFDLILIPRHVLWREALPSLDFYATLLNICAMLPSPLKLALPEPLAPVVTLQLMYA